MFFSRSCAELAERATARAATICRRAEALEDELVARVGVTPVLSLLWLLLCGILLVGYVVHEPWRDETQAWLMARDMDFFQLWSNAGTEGHPIGWHLLIKPLIWLGLPFTSLRIVNIVLVLLAAGIVLYKAPFRTWQRGVIALSIPFQYFGVWARSYSLLLAVSMALAAVYARRHERPLLYAVLLGALANIFTLFMPFAGLMGLWWACETISLPRERRRFVLQGVVLWSLLMLAAVHQIIPPADMMNIRMSSRWDEFLQSLSLQRYWTVFGFVTIPALCILPWIVMLWRNDRILGVIAFVSMGFFQVFQMVVYKLRDRHFFVCFVIMIVTTWILQLRIEKYRWDPARFRIIFACFFILTTISCYEGFRLLRVEYVDTTSNAWNAMPFVQKYMQNVPIAAHKYLRASTFLVSMPDKKFWSPVSRQWETFARFDSNYILNHVMSVDAAAEIIFRDCPVERPWVIFTAPWSAYKNMKYSLVWSSTVNSTLDEDYYIYAPNEELWVLKG